MGKQRLTKWFDPDVKPKIVGVYEVKLGNDVRYAYFDGKRFGYRTCQEPQVAYDMKDEYTGLPSCATWRGLAEKPE